MLDDLLVIVAFLKSIRLSLNIQKTKFMIFSTRNSNRTNVFERLSFTGGTVQSVSSFIYLGLFIDQFLTWESHINKVASTISPFIGNLRRVRRLLPLHILKNLYFAHVHSHLSYLLPLWGLGQSRMSHLQVLQNKAIKTIKFLPFRTSSVSLYNNGLLPLGKLAKYESILLIVKIIKGLLRIPDFPLINYQTTGRITRQSSDLRPPNYVLGVAQNSVFYSAVGPYNVHKRFSELNLEVAGINLVT
jgi:hypothetical protein